jgi:hypothetical protein
VASTTDRATVDERRTAEVRRHVEFAGVDEDIEHEIYHPDAVLEFPQSGERFEGVANMRGFRDRYPGHVRLRTPAITGDGDLWVAQTAVSYDGGAWQPAVAILEYRDEHVARETIYVAEPFDAPDWRAPWRSATGNGDSINST